MKTSEWLMPHLCGSTSGYQGAPQIDDLANRIGLESISGVATGASCEMDVDCTRFVCVSWGFDPERMCLTTAVTIPRAPRYHRGPFVCQAQMCARSGLWPIVGEDAAVPNGGQPLQLNELTTIILAVVLARANSQVMMGLPSTSKSAGSSLRDRRLGCWRGRLESKVNYGSPMGRCMSSS